MADEEELQVDTPESPPSEEQAPEKMDGDPPALLWISEGRDCVISTVYVYQDVATGRLKTILWDPSPELVATGMREFPVETKWSIPTKAQLSDYRERSSRYNIAARAVLVRRGELEELVIQNHLLEMKLGPEGHQTVVELKRDRKGVLTKESLAHINTLHASVMDMVFAKFIDEAALLL